MVRRQRLAGGDYARLGPSPLADEDLEAVQLQRGVAGGCVHGQSVTQMTWGKQSVTQMT